MKLSRLTIAPAGRRVGLSKHCIHSLSHSVASLANSPSCAWGFLRTRVVRPALTGLNPATSYPTAAFPIASIREIARDCLTAYVPPLCGA
jgi:hypothetical protein